MDSRNRMRGLNIHIRHGTKCIGLQNPNQQAMTPVAGPQEQPVIQNQQDRQDEVIFIDLIEIQNELRERQEHQEPQEQEDDHDSIFYTPEIEFINLNEVEDDQPVVGGWIQPSIRFVEKVAEIYLRMLEFIMQSIYSFDHCYEFVNYITYCITSTVRDFYYGNIYQCCQ
ncbi:hypothetical protein BDF21DRAFT_451989 [Thamnidium elegans]|nr:hypothetical protein BDF21DRAFT_451989 [Thamnidium elegans]